MNPIVYVILLVLGVFTLAGIVWKKNAVSQMLDAVTGRFGPAGKTITLVLGIAALGFAITGGAVGTIQGYLVDTTANVVGGGAIVGDTVGGIDMIIHDGISNATTTEDTVDNSDKFMTINSADASIADGEEYKFNLTITRDQVAYAGTIKVSCTANDKELDSTYYKNLIQSTAGDLDMDLNDHARWTSDGNTVYWTFSLAAGTNSLEVEVAADQLEAYHDAMVDQQDYMDIVCTASTEGGASTSTTTRIFADS